MVILQLVLKPLRGTTNQTGIFYEERWKKDCLGFCRATDRKSLTCLHFGRHVTALIWNLDPLAANTLYNDSLAGKQTVI